MRACASANYINMKVAVAFLVVILPLIVISAMVRPRNEIIVHWNAVRQTIDGFGASATGYTGTLNSAQADFLFTPQAGLGFSLLRLDAIPDNSEGACGCVANNIPATCVRNSKSELVSGDLQVAQLAIARGAKVLAAPWSPPANMKSSGQFCSGGSMIGNDQNYAAYAEDLASFTELLRNHGVALDTLSVQNEPDITNPEYNTATWQGQQIHDFVPYLSKALQNAGSASVKIAVTEESAWTFELMKETMAEPAVASTVGTVFGHAYALKKTPILPVVGERRVWQTEVSGTGKYDGSISDALQWAQSIHEFLTAGVNAWMYWQLYCGPQYFNHDNNMCLTDAKDHWAKRAFAMGQYSKFVRPGWKRVDVTNNGGLLVTAFKGPANKFAVVVINKSWWPVWKQSFSSDGGLRWFSVTPWLTSRSSSLAPQRPLAISNGEIRYTLPARSIVTFVGEGE